MKEKLAKINVKIIKAIKSFLIIKKFKKNVVNIIWISQQLLIVMRVNKHYVPNA